MPTDRPHVLVAAELRELLPRDPIPGAEVRWVAASEPTPQGNYRALVSLLSRRVGWSEVSGLPDLVVIANCAVGVDNIDLAAARQRGIIVTNTPDVLTESTADLTWALILGASRRLKEGMALVTSGAWRGWHPQELLGLELTGATLGVVGAGRIGQAVGRRAVGFGMHVVYTARTPKPDFERSTGARFAALSEVLSSSDVITLHVPATPETRRMIDDAALQHVKQGAILVNTARGDLVDEGALLAALDRGAVSAVGLDVFEGEPRLNPRLAGHPHALVVPHIGSATTTTRQAMAALALRNVQEVLAGRPPSTPVPIDAGSGLV